MEHVTHHGAPAPGPAASERHEVAPERETPARAGLALQGERKEGRADCADVRGHVQTASAKEKAGVMARAALVGLEVHELADATFIVSRWGFIKPVADLAAVQALVQRMGGAS